jgi:DNA-binding HxlR family transcriptional regulator
VTERSYDESCGMARALDVVGERWTLLVVRELLLGPKRFVDLRAGLPDISQNVLTRRIREMEHGGLIERVMLDPPANTPAYQLTLRGRQLRPVLVELARWGVYQPQPPETRQSAAALLLGLSALYDPSCAVGTIVGVLVVGRESFTVTASPEGIDTRRGSGEANFRADGTVAAIRTTLRGGADTAPFEASGELTITGDRSSFTRLSHCFPAPVLSPQV